MKPYFLVALVMLTLCATAEKTRANSITVNAIGGDNNSLLIDFTMNWTGNVPGDMVSGSWEGGTWQFVFSTIRYGDQNEQLTTYTLRTFWNDGWIPGGLGGELYSQAPVNFPGTIPLAMPAPGVFTDFGPNGLQYYLNPTGTASDILFTLDNTGHINMGFSLVRTAVPENGGTWMLLLLATFVLGALRLRTCK